MDPHFDKWHPARGGAPVIGSPLFRAELSVIGVLAVLTVTESCRPSGTRQSSPETSRNEPDAKHLFENGVARLTEQAATVFDTDHIDLKIDVAYDINKTDSLVSPLLGIVIVTEYRNGGATQLNRFQIGWRDSEWVVTDYEYTANSGSFHFHKHADIKQRIPTAVQACFTDKKFLHGMRDAILVPTSVAAAK